MARTDNDTWDLATSVGVTATLVAAARAIATKDDHPLIEDRFAEPLVRAVGVDFLTRWTAGELAGFDDDDSGWTLSQMPDAMAVRTRFFDDFFAAATQAGIRQAVILASGLDARAYRLAWPTGMTVFEIDQAQVIAFKTATLAELGAEPTADRRAVAVDLRDDWAAALTQAGFDPSRPTAWIAEGLLGYLPPDAQDRLLDTISELSPAGSRLASEAFPNLPEADRERAREIMQETTEKWRSHGFDLEFSELGYEGDRNDVDTYLDTRDWQSTATSMTELLAAQGRTVPPQGDTSRMANAIYYTSIKR